MSGILKTIANIAIKNENLQEKLEVFQKANEEITGLLTCIGGPLNDNKMQYTKEQLSIFFKIKKILDHVYFSCNY